MGSFAFLDGDRCIRTSGAPKLIQHLGARAIVETRASRALNRNTGR